MASFVKFEVLSEHLAEQVHKFDTHTLTVALTNTQPTASTDTVLTNITEVSYTFASSRDLTGTGTSRTGAVTTITAADLVITASGGSIGPFRYVVIYNNTPTSPADPLICYFDYGSSVTVNDGETFTIDFTTNLMTIT